MMMSGAEGSVVKSIDLASFPTTTGETHVVDADKHRAHVLEKCPKGRDGPYRLDLVITLSQVDHHLFITVYRW